MGETPGGWVPLTSQRNLTKILGGRGVHLQWTSIPIGGGGGVVIIIPKSLHAQEAEISSGLSILACRRCKPSFNPHSCASMDSVLSVYDGHHGRRRQSSGSEINI